MLKRALLLTALVAMGLLAVSADADARYWRRGWGAYPYGWGSYPYGWYDWPAYYNDGPYGPGYYNRYAAYPLPQPVRPDPAIARLRAKYASCPNGRIPPRWVKTVDKSGQVVMQHVMGRCR